MADKINKPKLGYDLGQLQARRDTYFISARCRFSLTSLRFAAFS